MNENESAIRTSPQDLNNQSLKPWDMFNTFGLKDQQQNSLYSDKTREPRLVLNERDTAQLRDMLNELTQTRLSQSSNPERLTIDRSRDQSSALGQHSKYLSIEADNQDSIIKQEIRAFKTGWDSKYYPNQRHKPSKSRSPRKKGDDSDLPKARMHKETEITDHQGIDAIRMTN